MAKIYKCYGCDTLYDARQKVCVEHGDHLVCEDCAVVVNAMMPCGWRPTADQAEMIKPNGTGS